MKKLLSSISILLLMLILGGCKFGIAPFAFWNDDVNERWKTPKESYIDMGNLVSVAGSEYTMLVVTDIHYGSNGIPDYRNLIEFIDDYNVKNAQGLVCSLFLGDASHTGIAEEYSLFAKFTEAIKEHTNAPMYSVLGNHDIFSKGFFIWEKFTEPGKPGFKFSVNYKIDGNDGSRSFYGMDSANSFFGDSQLEFFNSIICRDKNPKVMLTHEPIHQLGKRKNSYMVSFDQEDRLKMNKMILENNFDLYLCGHTHDGGVYNKDGYTEFCCKSYVTNEKLQCFYTVKFDEKVHKVYISEYENSGWKKGSLNEFEYSF